MKFRGLEKSSLIEWSGKIVAVAFVGGCNFRCPFCQNKDLVLNPERLPVIEENEILNHLESKKRWLDGLVITGGEPTMDSALPEFSKKVKELGFQVGIETNGSNPDMLKKLLERNLTDHIFLDIKAPLNWKKYRKAIGVDKKELFENVKKTISLLEHSNTNYEFRTTIVPNIVSEDEIIDIADQIKGRTKNYHLQQFIPQNTLKEKYEQLEPIADEKIREIREEIKDNFENCEIKNLPKG